jgi:hypothetical protein
VKVLDAIEAVAKGTAVDVSMPGGVGSRGTKYEANELALGDRGDVGTDTAFFLGLTRAPDVIAFHRAATRQRTNACHNRRFLKLKEWMTYQSEEPRCKQHFWIPQRRPEDASAFEP